MFYLFLQFLVDILPLGSGSVDPHIFSDPDPGSQKPKHWKKPRRAMIIDYILRRKNATQF